MSTEQADVPLQTDHRVRVHGHGRAVQALLQAARTGRVGQAYLFAGPPAVGKRALARLFAQALLCAEGSAGKRPCGLCRTCRLVSRLACPDLHWLEPPLRIEAVRELQRDLILAPNEGPRRIAVLPEIESASLGAANSLLKTLEEPPGHVVLVVTTAEIGAVLPTIRSRCQPVPLRPMALGEVEAALTAEWGVEQERAVLLARLSGGRLGWAIRALEDESVLTARRSWLDGLMRVLGADLATRFELAAELARAGEGIAEGLTVWSSWWRDLLLVHHGVEEPVVNRDCIADLAAAADRYPATDAARSLRAVEDALRRLAANTAPQITLEVLLLELPA